MRLAALIVLLAVTVTSNAATYYVDFVGGSDAAAGTSTGAAWKHCPGDVNATGTAGSATLSAGDTVKFKGGVNYRGKIFFSDDGADGNPITYDGNTAGDWGTGKAIIDGTVAIATSWTVCTNATDARGNANFANIYWTTIPAGVSNGWPQLLMNGTNMTHTAQHPNPTNQFLFDIVSSWTSLPQANVTVGTVTDTGYFTQSDSAYWNEAWIGVWVLGNAAVFRTITNFNTGTDTVGFSPPITPYTDRDSYYTVFNHPALIDQPGEHAISTNDNRIYLWPPNSDDPDGYSWGIGNEPYAFAGAPNHNLVIDGFYIVGQYSTVGQAGYNSAVIISPSDFTGNDCRNNVLRNTEIKFIKCMDRDWLITMNGGNNVNISNNVVAYSFGGGIYCGGTNVLVSSNYFFTLTGTAVYMPGSKNSSITRNNVDTILGTHANGISVYVQSTNCTLSFNRLRNVLSPITYENSENLNFICNLVDAMNSEQAINDWGGCSGIIRWVGNTLVNNSLHRVLNIGVSSATVTYDVRNNVIDGGGSFAGQNVAASYNIYTGLNDQYQTAEDGWALGTGESTNTAAALFINPSTGDWRLKLDSTAIGAGANLSAYYSVGVNGQAFSVPYDVGAYPYTNHAPRALTITGAVNIGTLIERE